jgi:hypothetical protein
VGEAVGFAERRVVADAHAEADAGRFGDDDPVAIPGVEDGPTAPWPASSPTTIAATISKPRPPTTTLAAIRPECESRAGHLELAIEPPRRARARAANTPRPDLRLFTRFLIGYADTDTDTDTDADLADGALADADELAPAGAQAAAMPAVERLGAFEPWLDNGPSTSPASRTRTRPLAPALSAIFWLGGGMVAQPIPSPDSAHFA